MATEDQPERPKREIPPDSTAIKQSMWAWLWSVVPWIILALVYGYVAYVIISFWSDYYAPLGRILNRR